MSTTKASLSRKPSHNTNHKKQWAMDKTLLFFFNRLMSIMEDIIPDSYNICKKRILVKDFEKLECRIPIDVNTLRDLRDQINLWRKASIDLLLKSLPNSSPISILYYIQQQSNGSHHRRPNKMYTPGIYSGLTTEVNELLSDTDTNDFTTSYPPYHNIPIMNEETHGESTTA